MNNEQLRQHEFELWLLDNPGHLKTSFSKLAERFDLDYSTVKDSVRSIKDRQLTSDLIEFKSTTSKIRENKKSLPKPFKGDLRNVLVIGDTHIPFVREGYLEHCREVQEQFNCGTVIHIGDIIDNNYSSYHDSNPDGISAGDELAVAIDILRDWYQVFPQVRVTLGNHDQIIQRKAYSSGLSQRWIKGLAEVLEVPNWEFDMEFEVDGVIYTHGTGTAGDKAAFMKALNRRKSIVSGHLHTAASITWNVSDIDRIFAMQVGCGIDDKQYSFDYAKTFTKKSIISCAVVLNNGKLPIILPMEL